MNGDPINFTDPLGLVITGAWDGMSASVTDWTYTGLTADIARKGLVDRLGYFNFLISGTLNAAVKCTDDDPCNPRTWRLNGSANVKDLKFKTPFNEPVLDIPGMSLAIWADKILRVSQFMYEWRGMIESAGKELLNSPTYFCRGAAFQK